MVERITNCLHSLRKMKVNVIGWSERETKYGDTQHNVPCSELQFNGLNKAKTFKEFNISKTTKIGALKCTRKSSNKSMILKKSKDKIKPTLTKCQLA